MNLAVDAINHYYNHPTDFVAEVIGVQPDPWQDEALTGLAEHHFLAIRSGSGVGKSCLMAWVGLWFLFTRPNSKVPCTAPSQHQLYDVLWSEYYKWISKSQILQNFFNWTATKISVKGYDPTWFAVARTSQVKPGSDVAEGLQGFHEERNILFEIDEASGVADAVYPAVEGALTTEDAFCLLAGNPTRVTGFFHDIFTVSEMAKYYKHMHISCYDSPRVTERYIDMMRARYGEDHPIFQIKVLGEFPEADVNLLIPPSYLDQMVNNSPVNVTGFNVEIGVDIGRSHAASVLCVHQGYEIIKWDEKHKRGAVTDTTELTRWVTDHIVEFEPTSVKIDAVGLGAGVYDNLKEVYGSMIVPVIGQASCADEYKARYTNLRAQGYWELRELIPHLYCKRWPDRLITELGDIRTKQGMSDKIKIESKDDMLARAMKSPDYADALMYAFLDSNLCLGISPAVYNISPEVLKNFSSANKGLKKSSMWGELAMSRNRSKPSRWSTMYG